jgi:hypothetical protein
MKFEMRGYVTDYQNILKIYISNSRVQKYIKHVLNIFFQGKVFNKNEAENVKKQGNRIILYFCRPYF